jgi:sporulation protein YlmC with PRC-barrel domain
MALEDIKESGLLMGYNGGVVRKLTWKEVATMDIPVNAEVVCVDGVCGQSTYVIINPISQQVTHVVVKEKKRPHTERLVPIDQVSETSPNLIRLRATTDELSKTEPFIKTEYIQERIPDVDYIGDFYWVWPYRIPEVSTTIPVTHKRIPHGELAVRRGARVEATDGLVGQVDEFLVDPTNEHITHLVLREGHLWGQKDVTIPVSQIDHIQEQEVFLKLDKASIKSLPTVPIHRGLRSG